jgi:hypothetical protein
MPKGGDLVTRERFAKYFFIILEALSGREWEETEILIEKEIQRLSLEEGVDEHLIRGSFRLACSASIGNANLELTGWDFDDVAGMPNIPEYLVVSLFENCSSTVKGIILQYQQNRIPEEVILKNWDSLEFPEKEDAIQYQLKGKIPTGKEVSFASEADRYHQALKW